MVNVLKSTSEETYGEVVANSAQHTGVWSHTPCFSLDSASDGQVRQPYDIVNFITSVRDYELGPCFQLQLERERERGWEGLPYWLGTFVSVC
jgi:hypothetical protein